MKYTTRSGNNYYFKNGRVTCDKYGVDNEPVWQMGFDHGCLRFRIKGSGWFLTTPVVSTEPF